MERRQKGELGASCSAGPPSRGVWYALLHPTTLSVLASRSRRAHGGATTTRRVFIQSASHDARLLASLLGPLLVLCPSLFLFAPSPECPVASLALAPSAASRIPTADSRSVLFAAESCSMCGSLSERGKKKEGCPDGPPSRCASPSRVQRREDEENAVRAASTRTTGA
ncbi:hypothetical protein AcV7_005486 [Taiwanofungus camphoratus]|nr:hypothetical protein AcV7_005486 [Antrodia cinnamomea]